MISPAACPGSLAGSVYADKCWANVPCPSGTAVYQCRTSVDPDDELGLCSLHIAELISTDEQ